MKYNECVKSTLTIIDDDNALGYAMLQLYHWNGKQRRKRERAITMLIEKTADNWVVQQEKPYYFATAKPPEHGLVVMWQTRHTEEDLCVKK